MGIYRQTRREKSAASTRAVLGTKSSMVFSIFTAELWRAVINFLIMDDKGAFGKRGM
jgi:hypothetical protein